MASLPVVGVDEGVWGAKLNEFLEVTHEADGNLKPAAVSGAGGILKTLLDAKGDLIVASGADTAARLAAGTNGHVLTLDSGEALGIKWAAAPGGGIAATIVDAKGDLIVASAADTVVRLPAGTNGQVLSADSAETTGLKWIAAGGGLLAVYDMDHPSTGIVGDGTTDDSAAIIAFIAALPDGALIYCAKQYLCLSMIDLSGRRGLRFHGVGGFSYTDADDYGARFIAGTLDMTLFKFDNSALLVHAGPEFEHIGFFDAVGGATMFEIGNTNRFGWTRCLIAGTQSGTRSKAGVVLTNSANDLAYWWFRDTSVLSFGDVGSYTAGKGGLVCSAATQQAGIIDGGAWQGNWPSVDVLDGVGLRVIGVKFDAGNPAFRDAGVATEIVDCEFEVVNNNTCGYQAVSGASTPILLGCKFKRGGSATGTTGWIIDAGVFGAQIIAPYYEALTTNFVDNGTDTMFLRGSSSATVAFMKVRGISFFAGTGSPEGVVTAPKGSQFFRTDGGASTAFYVKESGAGNTGWIAYGPGTGIAATIVDAKGDIIAATAADTVSRLAVGANGTALFANSAQATGLEWVDAATQAELDAHTGDTSAAHAASAISLLDSANDFTATDVEGALAELQGDHEADAQALADHLADAGDAHDASAISFVPAGTIAATTVQAAIEEVASEAGGGGGSVATDAIFDAKGDLPVGTGADTADNLPVGANLSTRLVPHSGAATGLLWLPHVVRRSANATPINANITLANDDEMLFALAANEEWFFQGWLLVAAADANMDVKIGWSVPSGCTMQWGASGAAGASQPGYGCIVTTGTPVAVLNAAGVLSIGALNGVIGIGIAGTIVNGATPGDANLQFAQNTSVAANLTPQKNSLLLLWRLA